MEENHVHAISSPFSSDSSQTFESSNSVSRLRYYGLQKRHFLKNFRLDLIQLSNYTFSVSPPFRITHKIMSVVRIMQFLLPCLIPSFFNFWREGTVDQVAIGTLAVLYYLIPPTAFFQASYILLIIYDIIQLIIIIIVICSTYYYKKFAKLPSFIPSFINFYHSTVGYYIHPIILYIICESISFLTTNETRMRITLTRFIILAIISLICILFNFLFMIIATSQTLLLRPNSLASLLSYPRYIIIFATSLINIFFGIAVNLNKIFQIVFLSLNILLYLFTIISVFTNGGFIRIATSNIVLSSSITGAVFTIADLILIILDKKGSLAIFFSFVIFFVLMMIINFFVLQYISMNHLKLLDKIYEDTDLFYSLVKSPNHFLQLVNDGINFAHPIIIDLTFFTKGVERWPNNQLIYFIYAKFIAIYPEETLTLKYIFQSVKMQKLSGSAINCIKKQTKMIMNKREYGLTNELRYKINAIKKQNRSTKHKLGHLWDVVIRGNLSEIEVATKHAIQAINETNANFKHLLNDYQNNRNVTHFYSIFLKEVVADHALSNEMHLKTKFLLPGTTIIEDQMHDYGIKMYPNLPNSIRPKDVPAMGSTLEMAQHLHNDLNENEFEKEKEKNLDQIAGLKETIEKLSIPSISGTKIIRILIFLFLFFIPCVSGLIYLDFYIKELQKPLKFLSSLAQLGTFAYHVISFSTRYIGESLLIFNKIPDQNREPPRNFGYSWDTKEQLEYILNETIYALQDFGNFLTFEEDNYYIKQVQSLIFQNTVPYNYFISATNLTSTKISLQAALLDITIQQKIILSGTEINQTILNSGIMLNPLNNIKTISLHIRYAMNYMTEYIKNNNKNVIKIGKILSIVITIIIVVVYSVTLIIEIKWINSNKQEAYQCLFSLPKNIVSELAENRFFKNGNKQAEEMNKQDENIIKIFHSGGSSEDSLSDSFLLIFGSILLILLSVFSAFLFIHLFRELSQIVRNSAPHLHYLLASYSKTVSSLNYLNVILFEVGGFPISTHNFNYSLESMQSDFEFSRYYYHLINAGGSLAEEIPFKGFINGVKNANINNCTSSRMRPLISELKKMYRKNMSFSKAFPRSNFNDLSSILQCSPVDITYVIIEPIIMYSLIPYQQGAKKNLDPKSPTYESIWIQLISPVYDLFIEPMHREIVPTIVHDLKKRKNQIIPLIISFLIIALLFEFIMYIQINRIENHIRSVLRLLLHCDPSVIFSSVKITRVLSGDFSVQKTDSLGRRSNFFDTVFKSLPDAIMYANSEMIIQSANQACKSTFGEVELVGKSIKNFFMSKNFNGNIEVLFINVNSNPTEEIAYKLEGSSDLRILKASSMIACGMFVMSCRNVTQSHRYNTLILEEKQNSDKLLSTILPPSLVSRVQEGEKNISFSVQSASILFCDIVSFTPWCGSLPAETVMKTLNILFKRFDSILDSKPTMTKIKCIGDCYMAAGGIFAELNQPAVHAKEVVSFGLQCIKEIILINAEINQNLRIRIGINTGGPIVAGVLGIGKPTFEILGPAINRAQQMEQNGMPMMVHISMSVYELICGFNFKFSQQRQIQLKNEVVRTYLVEP